MLNTAVSGLLAFQRALDTTSHNIANATTEGYSRQRVHLSSRDPEPAGNGFIGKGVSVSGIERIYDQFVINQLNTRTASYNQSESYFQVASQLESIFADPSIGLSPALDRFFNSVHGVANDPTSIPARQVMLSEAQSLSETFRTIDRQVDQIKSGVNTQVGALTIQLNDLAKSIAQLNQEIVVQTGATGQPPNDLLDQRDRLINQVSQITNVTTLAQENGAVNVYIGTGQSLVLNVSASQLVINNDEFDPLEKQIALQTNSGSVNITGQLSGGKLGGLLGVKNELLEQAQTDLGLVAVSMVNVFNQQHRAGENLDSQVGVNFFSAVDQTSPQALPSSLNNPASGSVGVTLGNVAELKASDYRLNYNGANFSLIRLSDQTVVDTGFTVADMPRTVNGEGFSLSLTGSVAAGDSFLVRPTHYAAEQMGLNINDTSGIAAAPINSNVGDNANALALANIRNLGIMDGGNTTIMDAYANSVANIGVTAGQAGLNAQANRALMDQAFDARESVSGVNLDEEAVNLMRYQQAYQAAAQVITVADSLFQSLLSAVGR